MIRFLHISDTHFGPTKDYVMHGKNTFRDNCRLVQYIKDLPSPIDFVMHTGDMVATQDPASYTLAEEVLRQLPHPLYLVAGNHDMPGVLKSFALLAPHKNSGTLQGSLSYSFDVGFLQGIVIDVKNPDDKIPSGLLTDEVLKELEKTLTQSKKRFALFTHFPILSFDAPWIDAHLLTSRGQELHRLLVRFKDRCAGVFLGHIHQASAVSQDGITYYSAPSSTFLFGGWPSDEKIISYDVAGLPGCNLVSIDESKTVVKFLHYSRE